ncbi:MAG: phosphate regulon transcriptional regulator PhoB [Hyphomicrobiales bacterium]
MTKSLLVVEDDEPIQVLLKYNLEAEGYVVRLTDSGDDVGMMIDEERPDLVLLDWMLPGLSGIDVCRMIRGRTDTKDIPIIMLTARGEETERIRGLSTGADDYVVKPFSVPELLARVNSLLRRVNIQQVSGLLSVGNIEVNRHTRRVSRAGKDVDLSPTEYRLLEHLMENPGRVYPRETLLDAVWGRDIFVDERTVDVHVGRLRKALNKGRKADPIRTVRGVGYSFDERYQA